MLTYKTNGISAIASVCLDGLLLNHVTLESRPKDLSQELRNALLNHVSHS